MIHANQKARMTGVLAGLVTLLLPCNPRKKRDLFDRPLYLNLQYIEIKINGAVRPDRQRCVAPSKAAVRLRSKSVQSRAVLMPTSGPYSEYITVLMHERKVTISISSPANSQ